MEVKSESEVAQSCLTLRDPKDYSPPGSSVHGLTARTLIFLFVYQGLFPIVPTASQLHFFLVDLVFKLYKNRGDFLAFQWLRILASIPGGHGFNPWLGN